MKLNKTNIFIIPVLSFVPTYYKKIVRESGGRIFAALLIWILLFNLMGSVSAIKAVNELIRIVEKECPEFDVSDGKLTMSEAFRYDEGGVYYEMDDSLEGVSAAKLENITGNGKYTSALMAGRNAVAIYSDGRMQVVKYSEIADFSLSKRSLCDKWLPMLRPLMLIFYLFVGIWSIGIYYLATLILQFAADLIALNFYQTVLTFPVRFKITLLAKFPVYVFLFFVKKLGITIRLLPNILLQIITIALILFFYCNKKRSEGSQNSMDDFEDRI